MTAKVIGRILSLGFPLPGVQVDNHNFINAPSFFDYDAIVVEPHALSELIDGVVDGSVDARTFGDRPVRNEPRATGDPSLADVLLRRRDETRILLEAGGLVVCFAHPAVAHTGISGIEALDDYSWLPLPEGFAVAPPYVLPAEGSQAHVIDFQHPLAAFVHSQLANVTYRARFEPPPAQHACVFATSRGGAAIGVEAPLARGRLIFLPALRVMPIGDARYAMSDALQAGIRRALGVMAEGRAPAWVAAHPLPGLAERAAVLEAARSARDEAQGALDDAEASYDELAKYGRLLWQEGALGLEEVVIDALRLLALDVYATDRREMEMRIEGRGVLFEVEGSDGAVDLAAHHRLRQRIERAIERRGEAPRGVLFVNGRRLEDPQKRASQVTDALRLAAETMRYCIAPASTLHAAVEARLGGDAQAVTEYVRRLVETDGVLG